MPDWKDHVRPRLSGLRLSPTREAEILRLHVEKWRRSKTSWRQFPASKSRARLQAFRCSGQEDLTPLLLKGGPNLHQGHPRGKHAT